MLEYCPGGTIFALNLRFPVDGFNPLQAAPTRECTRATLLFKYLDALIEELAHLSDLQPPVTDKTSKVRYGINIYWFNKIDSFYTSTS